MAARAWKRLRRLGPMPRNTVFLPSDAHLPKVFLELSLQRSPPRLFTAAAWSGLGPAPESRSRGALPHLSRSCTTQISLRTDTLHVSLQHTLVKKAGHLYHESAMRGLRVV